MIKTTFRDKEVNVKEQLTIVESLSFINSVADTVVDLEDNTFSPLFFDIALISNFIISYTDIEQPDLEDVYANLNEYQTFVENTCYADNFNRSQYNYVMDSINSTIEFNKQQIIHKQTSALDEIAVQLSNLLSTLNSKAQELDVKKLDKVIKKLNPEAILKAYQKSGIGDDVRDKAIEELRNENIKLKNDISARNVKA
ncbi:MAG: hypothetical protein K0S41_2072 [Anaerocolumna sp.]|jgi:hypothetical protein|nr:hypothetical protein [Anaerocolumna sp.]